MPFRTTVFANNHYYHLYNRGVEKRTIFEDEDDYKTFIEILVYYLVPDKKKPTVFSRKTQLKISDSVSLLCYCLMPNHFHFLIKQRKNDGIITLMHALGITYSKYFNKKYDRVGSLFQGRFKAKLVNKDEYLLQLSKYIHLNPKEFYKKTLGSYPYSSFRFYLEGGPKEFIDTDLILSYFSSKHKGLSYQAFAEEIEADFSSIQPLLLE